jgi:hypothetical protein
LISTVMRATCGSLRSGFTWTPALSRLLLLRALVLRDFERVLLFVLVATMLLLRRLDPSREVVACATYKTIA